MRELVLPKYWLARVTGRRTAVNEIEYTEEEKAWDDLMCLNPPSHYMQSSAWAESKTKSSWPVSRYIAVTKDSLVPLQVFSRTIPGFGRLHYSPEATGVTPSNLATLTKQIKQQYVKGMTFKLELYQPYSAALVESFKDNGWLEANSVQHRNTVQIDLTQSEELLFNSFKKRARYEIRLAERYGVRVEKVPVTKEKLDLLATLMSATAKRSGAFFRKEKYNTKYWSSFTARAQGNLYFAWHDFDLLAGAFVINFGESAWYKDGGSVRQKTQVMGPRLLQWEIMRDLKRKGIKMYDLCGIPSPDNLEQSSMKGLFTFKTAFSNSTVRFMPTMELPLGKRYAVWPKSEPQFLRLYSGFRRDFWY